MSKTWEQVDNSALEEKAAMREKYLPKAARVLDLFCGNVEMYKRVYRGKAEIYHGVDKEKIHTDEICTLQDNIRYIKTNDISSFNVFDLDDYGSPWKLLYLIIKKVPPGNYTFFITDGLPARLSVNNKATKFISATEQIPNGLKLTGLYKFYVSIFGTMLRTLEKKYGCEVKKAVYFKNQRGTVYYWTIKLTKYREPDNQHHSQKPI